MSNELPLAGADPRWFLRGAGGGGGFDQIIYESDKQAIANSVESDQIIRQQSVQW